MKKLYSLKLIHTEPMKYGSIYDVKNTFFSIKRQKVLYLKLSNNLNDLYDYFVYILNNSLLTILYRD